MAWKKKKLVRPTSAKEDTPKEAKSEPKKFNIKGTELEELHSSIVAAHGEETVKLGRRTGSYPRIPTGVFTLDLALAGGFLTSRGHMIYGERSAGKSTLALRAAASAQRIYPDHAIAYVDIEGTYDPSYFAKLGGNPEYVYHSEPESGEHAVDVADGLARTKEISLIIVDSIAMLTPMTEIDESAEKDLMGVHARLIGKFLRRVTNAMIQERHRGHRVTILHLNQFRSKIGLVFGDPRALPGGRALEFSTSQQVEIKNSEKVNSDGVVTQNEHNFKISKDKTGGRYKSGKFFVVRDEDDNHGWPETTVIQAGSMLSLAERVGLSDGSKEFYGYGKERGKDAWQSRFVADPEMCLKLQSEIIGAYRKKWGIDD